MTNNEEDLQKAIDNYTQILELEENEGFKKLMDLFKGFSQSCDDQWHLIRDDEQGKLKELRIMKCSYAYLVNVLETIRLERDKNIQTLEEIQNPDLVQGTYYDTEGDDAGK